MGALTCLVGLLISLIFVHIKKVALPGKAVQDGSSFIALWSPFRKYWNGDGEASSFVFAMH